MKNNKKGEGKTNTVLILAILLGVAIVIIGILLVFLFPKEKSNDVILNSSVNNQVNSNTLVNNNSTLVWPPIMRVDNDSWSEDRNDLFFDANIRGADEFGRSVCMERVGEIFMENLALSEALSSISYDKKVYYLSYVLSIPQKGIDYKTTTEPASVKIAVREGVNGFELFDGTCIINPKVLSKSFISKEEALVIAHNHIIEEKVPIPSEIGMNFDLSPSWKVYYNIPVEKSPKCRKVSGVNNVNVELIIDAVTNRTIENQECTYPR